MTDHFSVLDLYTTVTDNDVDGLYDAILILGVRIHHILIYDSYPALVYAAKLGHVQQTKILLDDFLRYQVQIGPDNTNVARLSHYNVSILRELLRIVGDLNRNQPSNEWQGTLKKIIVQGLRGCETWKVFTIKDLVKAEALSYLEIDEEKSVEIMKSVIEASVKYGRTQAWDIPHIRDHPEFVRLAAAASTPLAILRGDVEDIREIFRREGKEVDGDTSSRILALNPGRHNPIDLEIRRHLATLARHPWREVMNLILHRNSIQVFEAIFDILQNIITISEEIKLFDHLLDMRTVIGYDSALTLSIINHKHYNRSKTEWLNRYYEFIFNGNLKNATCLRPLIDLDNANIGDDIIKKSQSRNIASLNFETEEEVALIHEALQKLPYADKKTHQWMEKLTQSPQRRKRPDLVMLVRKFGIEYTESDVLNEMNGSGRNKQLKMEFMKAEEPLGRFRSWLFNKTWAVCVNFLGSAGHEDRPIVLHEEWTENDADLNLLPILEICVQETGKRVHLDSRISEQKHSGICLFIAELEAKRSESFSLKKFCRLTIRKSVLDLLEANKKLDHGKFENAMVSMFKDGYLPRSILEYLLYKDGERPFYHQLVTLMNHRRK